MKKALLVVLILGLSGVLKAQTKKQPVKSTAKPATVHAAATKSNSESGGHEIAITLTPFKNAKIYLGSYYGKGKVLVDSCMVNDKSQGVFKGDKKLVGGIYFVVSPQYSIQFELLVGEQQHFTVVGDSTNKDKFVITHSNDNDLFKNYSKYTGERGNVLNAEIDKLKTAKTKADSTVIQKRIIEMNKDLQVFRDSIIQKNSGSLLGALLAAMRRPEAPTSYVNPATGKVDSAYPYHFVKEHFWDDVAFNDERLLRTPFFEPKVDDYFKYYVSPEPDSVTHEIKYMLLYARESKEMYTYLLTKFTNKYLSPEFMGQDKVFINIAEDYYLKGDTVLLDTKSRKMIIERYYSMVPNVLGNPAPMLELTDTTGKLVQLYDVKAKFTLVIFWDPTCGHCKEEVPRVDSIYKAKWKDLNVKIYSVNIKDEYIKEWKEFLRSKKISKDWIQVYPTKESLDALAKANVPNYHQLYDVNKTPTLYLLDEQKRIIAKHLTVQQFDDLIAAKLKKAKETK